MANLRQGHPAGVVFVALPPDFQSSKASKPLQLIWAPAQLGISLHLLLLLPPPKWPSPSAPTPSSALLVNTRSGSTTAVPSPSGCSGITLAQGWPPVCTGACACPQQPTCRKPVLLPC